MLGSRGLSYLFKGTGLSRIENNRTIYTNFHTRRIVNAGTLIACFATFRHGRRARGVGTHSESHTVGKDLENRQGDTEGPPRTERLDIDPGAGGEARVPLTTVQRRRKHLESKYIDISYSLRLRNLGFRRIDFFLYTAGGNTSDIGRELLKHKEIVSVGRSVGEHTIDLRAEAIVKDSAQLLDLLELIKAMPNVRDVIWSEIVDVMGKKRSIPSEVIDAL
jgi:hypothetical protein